MPPASRTVSVRVEGAVAGATWLILHQVEGVIIRGAGFCRVLSDGATMTISVTVHGLQVVSFCNRFKGLQLRGGGHFGTPLS